MSTKLSRMRPVAHLLNLLLPGLGHVYVREYLFGLFIFLVMLMAAVVAYVTFLIPMSKWAVLFLLGLPLLFYVFTFVDLQKTFNKKAERVNRSNRFILLIAMLALTYQFLSPTALVCFGRHNGPEIFRQDSSHLEPLYGQGEMLVSNRLSYQVDLILFDSPALHRLPERFDVVRYLDSSGERKCGVVLGYAGEEIEVIDATLLIDNIPVWEASPLGAPLAGQWLPTSADAGQLLVADFRNGRIVKTTAVNLDDLHGKVSRIL